MNRVFAISIACIFALFGVNLVIGDVSEIRQGIFFIQVSKAVNVAKDSNKLY